MIPISRWAAASVPPLSAGSQADSYMNKRFRFGDEVLVRYSYGQAREQPFTSVTICRVVHDRGLYDYVAVDISGAFIHLRDTWVVPTHIVITEDVDLTDLLAGS